VTSEQEDEAAGLMRRAQDGDRIAYASLLTLLTTVTRHFVRRRAGSSATWVDDVVQETLLSVHGARQTYDASRPFGPWFYAIASNRMIDAVRRERRVRSREVAGDQLPDRGTRAAAPAHEEIDVEAIRAAVAALPVRQRDVIDALKFQDQSVREVAGRMAMSESAVKVTAHRGYRTLKRLLGVESGED
jgi:RNA polymerase sigma-70 factor (ECF subfamily)